MSRRADRQGLNPQMPSAAGTTDFVVVVFVLVVATVLVVLTIGLAAAALFGDTADVKVFFAVLTTIMTTLIGALVGYIAGKRAGRTEAQTERTRGPVP